MTLSVEQISKLEESKIRAKKVYENYDEKLNNFLNEQLVELKKQNNSISNFSENEIKDLKISFQSIQSEKSANELYSEFPFEEMWAIMGLALSADPSGVAPIIFGAINILFNSLGLFNSQERFFKQIMEAVEKLIDHKLSQERERQCIIKFQQLQKTGDDYFVLAEEYFSRNGNKNVSRSIIPNDIQVMTNEQLNSSLQFQLMIYRDKITDGLIYFKEESELINTIGFYILTASQYLCLQRDCHLYGKEWGFSDFDVEDAKKKIHDYTIEFFEITVKSGWKLSRHMHSEETSPIFGYYRPPYFDVVRKFKNADFTYYPHRAFDYQRNVGEIHFNCGDERGSHLLYPGLIVGFSQVTNSLSSGFKGLTAGTLNLQVTLIVKFESIKKRSFKVKIHHHINGNATWVVESGPVSEVLSFNQGTEKEFRNSYFVYNESLQNPPHATNESKLITVENEQVTFKCIRSMNGGTKTGYDAGSKLYLIELIFD
ncbi:N-terminal delta endotoxin domain-containing protein [Dictyostelium discoideum AX4]|uniref:N-terminal delta endotoxin domain-containing protein n=1 Tax=Dictyostelium discoideum TaxID=44689 RepID=Q54RI3_DICDI|nr:N-terminal delta endotoxin domain-containing protein [Dictyostelium discoideum AX4]EAL65892.1 N-terminal delta endotoxin domain-containing protein [Dictyostelium discoideum AX4]|eukprot:XP_639253.1 N-terminal delta endotoxin domain-containing protein [Dictyostelium discoideum AX4]